MDTRTPSAPAARRSSGTHRVLRQVHLWVGAWGALAAILFGASGIVLNHRFAMELPQGGRQTDEPVRIAVPVEARTSVAAMSSWLADTHGLHPLMQRVRPPGGPARVGTGDAAQPEQWTFNGGSASEAWSANYAAGDASLEIERTHHSLLGTLLRLHKSGGGGKAWILLGDSFGLAMVLLGITGISMWTRGRSARQMAFSVFGLSLLAFVLVLGAAYAT